MPGDRERASLADVGFFSGRDYQRLPGDHFRNGKKPLRGPAHTCISTLPNSILKGIGVRPHPATTFEPAIDRLPWSKPKVRQIAMTADEAALVQSSSDPRATLLEIIDSKGIGKSTI